MILTAPLWTDTDRVDEKKPGQPDSKYPDDPARSEEGIAYDVVSFPAPLLLALLELSCLSLLLSLVGNLLGLALLRLLLLLLVVGPRLLPAGHDLDTVAQLLGVRLKALGEVDPAEEGGDVTVLLVLGDAVACIGKKTTD